MNATYVAIGAAFIAIAATMLVQARKADAANPDAALAAKGQRLSGAMFIVAGAIFITLGLLGKGA
ncbi:hypothetical protein [Sphingomonas sp.]|uniref:hypothetical protein n=1 Tax=Sphingomonas sp. TaxID=28214 RepID=UPI00286EAAB7|nr:hypothetical protein [Sphingomonas sp.]